MATLEYERSDWPLILDLELLGRMPLLYVANMKGSPSVSDMSCNVHPYQPIVLLVCIRFWNHSNEEDVKRVLVAHFTATSAQ
jgi:hypothetical protein